MIDCKQELFNLYGKRDYFSLDEINKIVTDRGMDTYSIITDVDSYKVGHWPLYPRDTISIYSYFESRNGAKYNNTIFYGLQYIVKKYLTGIVVTQELIDDADELFFSHFGNHTTFNKEMWQHILKEWGGKLPLTIRAVPEGLPVEKSNVLMTVKNNGGPICASLTNYVETLLTRVWASSTTATLSYEIKKMIRHYLDKTCDDNMIDAVLPYMLHDFGARGVSSYESSVHQGSGHLLNFLGTDTVSALKHIRKYYNMPSYDGLGYSIIATEHSIMTANGESGEKDIFHNLVRENPTGVVACVIDSYNYQRFILQYARELKDEILARDGKLVFRPDSGDPDSVSLEVNQMLESVFGTSRNSKNYLVLNPKVGSIWGDGIDYNGMRGIHNTITMNEYAAQNTGFGCGGGLLQKVNRDDQRFAFKCSARQIGEDTWKDVWKKPLDISKASKRGRFKLIRNNMSGNKFMTVPFDTPGDDILEDVFYNGDIMRDMTFTQCRENTMIM